MYETINESDFVQRFDDMNRGNNFSYEGRKALFNYLEELESDTDKGYELDIISICCDYNEYENLKEFHNDYSKDTYETIEDIEQVTIVIPLGGDPEDDGFIIQAF